MEDWESDTIVEQWIRENDDTNMPLPSIESSPHLLISKVRKHYMEYLIKLLSENYENNQKLNNKNLYLPSAIWRCAKTIEMSAAQASMVVQLYRKSINSVVEDLKNSTKKGLVCKKLSEYLHCLPENEKKTQTTFVKTKDCKCKCLCDQRNIKKTLDLPKNVHNNNMIIKNLDNVSTTSNHNNLSMPLNSILHTKSEILTNVNCNASPLKLNESITKDLHNSDELMQQLEILFKDVPNDDDLFDGSLSEVNNFKSTKINEQSSHISNDFSNLPETELGNNESQKICLDDRLALLSGKLVNNTENSQDSSSASNKTNKKRISKWLCEEYFQKVKLYELLDQIRDCDRNKFSRIKEMMVELFGEDSDDEGVVSPLEESSEFVFSCKERIAPWVVEILTPYYVKGRIRGKTLFKSLAKHLIRLIYQCSKYPYEYEVQSFVTDFLNSHKMIRCEADFKEFKIENI